MSNSAARVAGTIGVFKWVIIAAQILYGIILLLVFNAQESWPEWTAAAGPVALFFMLLSALGTWVLFGWFQHTLSTLVEIARNTAPAVPFTYEVPPAPYERQA